MSTRHCITALLTATALGVAGLTSAQSYPTRPLRIIVPYGAGGASDGPTRIIAQELSKQLGHQVLVENRPGQGGMVGTEAAAKAAADGYTLLLASNPAVFAPALYPKLGFDPIEDFAPILMFGREPAVLLVHPSLPVNSVRELVAYAKAQPGKLEYASSGNGSGQHLFTALFTSIAEIQMLHVPYKGSGQVTADLLGGQVRVALPGLAAMMPHIREGKLRALAVTGANRSPLVPDVPTMTEAGVKGYVAYIWNGLQAPKGTPAAIVERIHNEVVTALRAPQVKAYMSNAAIEVIDSTPAEFGAFLRQERERWTKIVKEVGARVE